MVVFARVMADLKREPVFGIPYVVGSLSLLSDYLVKLAGEAHRPYLVAHSDVHVLTRILGEAEYGAGVLTFDFICPDGMPIVWLLRKKGVDAHRLYGPDVMEWMWDKGRTGEIRHFLLGGSEDACSLVEARLGERFPGAQVVGHHCPPMGEWPEGTNEQIFQRIRESRANCVWVGLGCPKQERWLFTHREQLPPAVYFGVGAAFNFHAGLVQQAPAWIRAHGLEWVYRLCREPRRLFKRYLVHNSRFLWYCLTRKV